MLSQAVHSDLPWVLQILKLQTESSAMRYTEDTHETVVVFSVMLFWTLTSVFLFRFVFHIGCSSSVRSCRCHWIITRQQLVSRARLYVVIFKRNRHKPFRQKIFGPFSQLTSVPQNQDTTQSLLSQLILKQEVQDHTSQ